MGLIEQYAKIKDNLNKEIADETRRLYLEGLTYQEALKKATKELSKVPIVANLDKSLKNNSI